MVRWRWLVHNWADTTPPSHADLAPLEVSVPIANSWPAVIEVVDALPRWHVESRDDATHTLRATRKTRLWGFTDDVTIRLEETTDGTRVHARSQSRIGKGDLGQNRRNLQELFVALQRHFGRSH